MRATLGRLGESVVGHALAAARFGDRLFVSPALRTVENFVLQRIGQVLLPDPTAVVVRVFIPRALRLVRAAAVGIVLQIGRNIVVSHLARGALGSIHRQDDRIGLFSLAHIDDGVAQRDQPLGRAQLFKRRERRRRHDKRVRVCHADVFARMNDEAAKNVHRVAPSLDQAESVVQRCVGVAPAQALAEGGQNVVIGVLVVGERLALNGLLGVGEGDVNAPVGGGRRGEDGEFERVVRRAQVPRAHLRDMRYRLFIHLRLVGVQPLARGERLFERATDLPVREPPELEDAAAGDDCGRHTRVGIFRRRTDKEDSPLLDGGQERIGLRFVEAVALVEQKVCLFAVQL